jgi:hypothetical protein
MDSDLQRLEDISSIRDALRQISQEASVAVDLLDAKGQVYQVSVGYVLGPTFGTN